MIDTLRRYANTIAHSSYYGWSARCTKASTDNWTNLRQRCQLKGGVAGAVLGDTAALPMRLVLGTSGHNYACTHPDMAKWKLPALGAIGALNCGLGRGVVWLGKGCGLALGVVSLPVGLLLGRSASPWIGTCVARGALLGAAIGRLALGPASISRSFSIQVLQAAVRALTSVGEMVGGAAFDFYAVIMASDCEEALLGDLHKA